MLRNHVLAILLLPLLVTSCRRDDAPTKAVDSDDEAAAPAALEEPAHRQKSRPAGRTKPAAKLAGEAKTAIDAVEEHVACGSDDPRRECGSDDPKKGNEPVVDERVELKIDGAPARGGAHAPVTLVVFSDFECPYCKKLEGTIARLRRGYGDDIRVVAMQRPLPMHAHARLAAKAALAAAEQNQYWAFHDALVAREGGLERSVLEGIATDLGLDLARFRADLDGDRLEERLDVQEEEALRLDVKGTPTLFVNGRRITGAQPFAKIEAEIEKELD